MPLKRAQDYAKKTVEWLSPCCMRIEIAGSIRRECFQCRDIDLVCIPRLQKGVNLLRRFLFEYIQRSGGKAHWLDPTFGPGCFGSGPYRENEFLLRLPKCRLDIYCATEENFIVTLIRATGSSEHIFKIEQLAMRGKNFLSPDNELFIQKQKMRPMNEQDFYAALGLEWVEPGARK